VQPEGVVEPRLRVVERGGGGPGRAEAPPAFAARTAQAETHKFSTDIRKKKFKTSPAAVFDRFALKI